MISGVVGELSANAIAPLALGQQVTWSSGAQLIAALPVNVTGCVVTTCVARGATGTQPASFTLQVGGVTISGAVSLTGIGPSNYLTVALLGSVLTLPTGGNITVTPLAATGGTCLFDVHGYVF